MAPVPNILPLTRLSAHNLAKIESAHIVRRNREGILPRFDNTIVKARS